MLDRLTAIYILGELLGEREKRKRGRKREGKRERKRRRKRDRKVEEDREKKREGERFLFYVYPYLLPSSIDYDPLLLFHRHLSLFFNFEDVIQRLSNASISTYSLYQGIVRFDYLNFFSQD